MRLENTSLSLSQLLFCTQNWWLMLIYSDWCWMMLIGAGWIWLLLNDAYGCWLILIDAEWCLLMLIDSDWCWMSKLKRQKVKKTKRQKDKKLILSFAQMLDQIPSELSPEGAKRGVRTIPWELYPPNVPRGPAAQRDAKSLVAQKTKIISL